MESKEKKALEFKEEDEETNIASSFTNKEGLSKKDLVMEAWKTCMNNRSQEMKRGYFNVREDKQGNVQKTWIPDTRSVFFSSVDSFDIMLTADFDEIYKTAKKDFLKKGSELFKKYGFKEYIAKQIKCKTGGYESIRWVKELTGKIIMPELSQMPDKNTGAYTKVSDLRNGKLATISWDIPYHQYMQELISIYDKLYSEIIIFLKRVKYFDKKRKFG